MEAIPSYFIYELSIGRPKQVGLEVVLVVAPAAERLLKLVHVDPEIRRVLGALAHRHRLVVRALIRLEGVVRHDRRPHDRRFLGEYKSALDLSHSLSSRPHNMGARASSLAPPTSF